MAFSNPATTSWQPAAFLNEIVTAINERYNAPTWGAPVNTVTPVERGDVIQKATFWANLQDKIEVLISSTYTKYWIIAHSGGQSVGATPAFYDGSAPGTIPGQSSLLPTYDVVSDVFEAMGCTGEEYTSEPGVYSWRRRTGEEFTAPGQMQYADIIGVHIMQDIQTVLKALIWFCKEGQEEGYLVDWIPATLPGDEGLGSGSEATRAAAIAAAKADWAAGRSNEGWLGDPGARFYVGHPSNWRCKLCRTREKGTAEKIRDDALKDLYWFTSVEHGGWEWNDQDDPVLDDKLKHFSTQLDQASGNGGANIYHSPDFLGADNFATFPPNAPAADEQSAGWEATKVAVAIDWRDWFMYY